MELRNTETATPLHVTNAICPDATFHNVNLERASFDDIKLTDATLNNVCLAGARIRDVNLSDVTIEDCNLTGMRINGVPVEEALAAYARTQ